MTSLPYFPRQAFAAANSCEGFKSYYGEVFSDGRTDRIYIIKGGPGTGKSHFMKWVARRARERGYAVTEYLCSSDPASLDGIILTREGSPTLGLLDGTPPHAREPALPGVREELVDLGAFWDPVILTAHREEVAALVRKKSEAYGRAYACLRGAGSMDSLLDAMVEPLVDTDRLNALAARLLKGQPTLGFEAIPTLRRALSMTGRHTLHSFEETSAALLLAEDGYGLGYRLASAMLVLSKERGQRVMVSYDPLSPRKPDGLLYPDTGLCLLTGDGRPPEHIPVRTLSLRRFVDTEGLRAQRGELRHTARLRNTLTDTALRHMKAASEAHFELERIYASAMDFKAKEAFTRDFCTRLFGDP